MKKYFSFCLLVLMLFAFIPGVNAEGGPAPGGQEFSCFQWEAIRGLDRRWAGWKIHLGGQVVADAVDYDANNRKADDLRWETLNLRITGTYDKKFHFFIEPDLLGIDTKNNLYEAWAGWNITPTFHVRAGQIKVALSTAFATRPENLPSIDYDFTPYLDGRYDLGVQADGSVLNGSVWCQGSAVAGKGFDPDGNRKSDPQYSIRAVAFPSRAVGLRFLQGGFVGLAFAWSPDYTDKIFVQSPLRATVFTTPDIDGDYYRCFHYEIGWYRGAVRLGVERTRGEIEDADIGGGRTMEFDQLTAWSGYFSWYITGEQARWERGRWLPPLMTGPKKPVFECLKRLQQLGCLELACRYSNADIDRGLFDSGITTYDPSTQEVRTGTVNLNWYPRPGLKIAAGWVKIIADHELGTLGGTNRDDSYVLRASLVF